jgi:hypothetical protein
MYRVQTGQMGRESHWARGSDRPTQDGMDWSQLKAKSYGERGRVTRWVDCWPRSRRARFRWLRIATGRSVCSLLLGINYVPHCASSSLVLQSRVYVFACA